MAALDDFLGRAYRSRCQGTEPEGLVIAEFQDAITDDPALGDEARARLAQIGDDRVLAKDFVSRVFNDFLKKALV